jgi:hypothetical protein
MFISGSSQDNHHVSFLDSKKRFTKNALLYNMIVSIVAVGLDITLKRWRK